MTDMETHFETMYRAGGTLPWDIGEPQPAVTRLADEGRFTGAVLDVGCGFGGNALFLASRGLAVTGVDIAPRAIELASEHAAAQGADVAFTVADVTELSGFASRFDTVLDSALYHCLSEQARRDCMTALHGATRPGATLHILCFSERLPSVFPEAMRVSERNLRETVSGGWEITGLTETLYITAQTLGELHARAASQYPGGELPPGALSSVDTDARGRVLLPAWQLAAVRV
ncbi:class I SAM-dependent methyltransferase [Amycolatopsis sp. NPDC059657]|uniref:class I SAM-dependent methyltransferase n=1 Tax=Amycolatopsis sp. NPDC059657 TaxID=3346899 RepID=UPI00366F8C58